MTATQQQQHTRCAPPAAARPTGGGGRAGLQRQRQRRWRAPVVRATPQQHHTSQEQQQEDLLLHQYQPATWAADAAPLFARLQRPPDTTPQQLWQTAAGDDEAQARGWWADALAGDLTTCRLLLAAAAATCATQQDRNRLPPLLAAAARTMPSAGASLADFSALLRVCAQAGWVPDKDSLAELYYGDSGGMERLYAQEAPARLVLLLADLSAALGSVAHRLLPAAQRLQQQQQQQALGEDELAAEAVAVQAAVQLSSSNLAAIQSDPLLAGELSAVGGYWLLRRLLPQVEQEQPQLLLVGLTALPGLGYSVLDADDADVLLARLAAGVPAWSAAQLAAGAAACLPCLGPTPPSGGSSAHLALLFAALGAAAGELTPAQAGRVLVVLAALPGFAPDPRVAQALLECALQDGVRGLQGSPRRAYEVLSAASELGAAPSSSQLEVVQQLLRQLPGRSVG